MISKSVIFTLILTIIVSIILVFSILFLFSSQIDAIEETLEKQTIHPCQKATIDNFELYKDNANLSITPNLSKEDKINWEKEFYQRDQQIKHSVIDNNCKDTMHEWVTEEFKESVKILLEKGF